MTRSSFDEKRLKKHVDGFVSDRQDDYLEELGEVTGSAVVLVVSVFLAAVIIVLCSGCSDLAWAGTGTILRQNDELRAEAIGFLSEEPDDTVYRVRAERYHNAIRGIASWYSEASCKREGTSGVWTASGERFRDEGLTCAMPDRRMFGRRFRVTNVRTGRSVIVTCNDYGPNKRLVRAGRVVDLSKGAFRAIASLKNGLIRVRVEEV